MAEAKPTKKKARTTLVDGIAFIQFDEKDVLRHKLVKHIIKAYKK